MCTRVLVRRYLRRERGISSIGTTWSRETLMEVKVVEAVDLPRFILSQFYQCIYRFKGL